MDEEPSFRSLEHLTKYPPKFAHMMSRRFSYNALLLQSNPIFTHSNAMNHSNLDVSLVDVFGESQNEKELKSRYCGPTRKGMLYFTVFYVYSCRTGERVDEGGGDRRVWCATRHDFKLSMVAA